MLTAEQYQEFAIAYPDCDIDKTIAKLQEKYVHIKSPVALLRKTLENSRTGFQKRKPIELPKQTSFNIDAHYQLEFNLVRSGRKQINPEYMFFSCSQIEKEMFSLWLDRTQNMSLQIEAEISMALYGVMPEDDFQEDFFNNLYDYKDLPFSTAWQRYLNKTFRDFAHEKSLKTGKTPEELKNIGLEIFLNNKS
jgi:hypothetical protein